MQSKFSRISEKEFLESYSDFAVCVRPFIIERLCKEYKATEDVTEKEYLHLLALEQFFLFYETLEGFFRAIKGRETEPFLDSLAKDLNVQNLYGSLKDKTDDKIFEELNVDLGDFPKDKQEELKQRVIKIANLWRNKTVYEVLKNSIPAFNKLKHKLLVYKDRSGKIQIMLEDNQEHTQKFFMSQVDGVEHKPPEDIDYLQDMSERFKCAISDLIAIRLLELK